MKKFVVWVDGKEDEAMAVEADSIESAHQELARKYGCIDEADYAQEHDLDGFPFNACTEGEASFYGVAHAL